MEEHAMLQRGETRRSEPGGATAAGPEQARLTALSAMLNMAAPVQRLAVMAPPPTPPNPPVQRTLNDAIVFAAHGGINHGWPPNEDNMIKALQKLSANPAAPAFIGLKNALLKGQSAEERARVEALIAGAPVSDDDGSGSSDADEGEAMDESAHQSSGEDHDADYERFQQAQATVAHAMGTLLPQLGQLIAAIEQSDRQQPDQKDPYLPGLKAAHAFIQAQASIEDGSGKIAVKPDEARRSFAETNLQTQIITFYKSFFELGVSAQENIILHETIHAVLGVTDVAYHWQRIFAHLPIDKVLANPDSFVARFRQSKAADTPLKQAAPVTSSVGGVDPAAVERQAGQAEAIMLWGQTEFPKITAQLGPGQLAKGPSTLAFENHYKDPLQPAATLAGWASLIATACDRTAPVLAMKMQVTSTTTESGGTAFVREDDTLKLIYRTNFNDMALWFCAKAFQEFGGGNASLAKALVAVYRSHADHVLSTAPSP